MKKRILTTLFVCIFSFLGFHSLHALPPAGYIDALIDYDIVNIEYEIKGDYAELSYEIRIKSGHNYESLIMPSNGFSSMNPNLLLYSDVRDAIINDGVVTNQNQFNITAINNSEVWADPFVSFIYPYMPSEATHVLEFAILRSAIDGASDLSNDFTTIAKVVHKIDKGETSEELPTDICISLYTQDYEETAAASKLSGFSSLNGMGLFNPIYPNGMDRWCTQDVCPFEEIEEFNGIVYVKESATGNGSGADWDNAHGDLAYVLHISRMFPECVSEIRIAEGTYLPKYDAVTNDLPGSGDNSRDVSFVIPDGVNIIGGYPKEITESNKNDKDMARNPKENETILSGNIGNQDSSNDNAIHVVIIPGTDPSKPAPIIDGITITDGNANLIERLPIEIDGIEVYTDTGAGIYIVADAVIKNTNVRDNDANVGGGIAIMPKDSKEEHLDVDLINVIIDNNEAVTSGGGIYYGSDNSLKSTVALTNVTVTENETTYGTGGGIYLDDNNPESNISMEINNSIIWNNKDSDNGSDTDNIANGSKSVDATQSIIEGSGGSKNWNDNFGEDKGGNIDGDPLFKNPNENNPQERDYGLQPDSPAIDSGSTTLYEDAPGTDIDTDIEAYGNPRKEGNEINRGAVENADGCPFKTSTVYVKENATGDGSSWDNAHGDLAYVLRIANMYPDCVSEIKIAEGEYKPKYDPETGVKYDTNDPNIPRDVTFVIPDGIVIEGGYPGEITESNKDDDDMARNPKENETILTGNIGESGDDSDNAYHVVIIPGTGGNAPVIDGVTITDGNANCTGTNCTTTIGDKNIPNNIGGGVVITDDAVIKNTTVRDNDSDGDGAGIFIDNPTKGNASPTEMDIDLINVIIDHNTSGGNGGGVHNNDDTTNSKTNVTLTNVTVADNQAVNGGGISGQMDVNNSIIWGNNDSDTTNKTPNDNVYNSGDNNVEQSIIEGSGGSSNWSNSFGNNKGGNIDDNPLFNDPNPESGNAQDRDYGLQPDSPAIDTGNTTVYEKAPGTDIDTDIDAYGNPRKEGSEINRGAVETRYCPPILIWTAANNTADWQDPANWYPNYVPGKCTEVYIPGDVTIFPSLTSTKANECGDIYFLPGAQLGQQHLLDYDNAYVQIDYGKGFLDKQEKITSNTDFVTKGKQNLNSKDRVQFGAGKSGKTLTRERWTMLSTPLKNIVTADYAFGGFPISYIRKFDPNQEGDNTFVGGRWAPYSKETTHEFKLGEGFGHFLYGDPADGIYSADHSSQYDALTVVKPAKRPLGKRSDDQVFGLGASNGIIHLPYYADQYLSDAHRNHIYSKSGDVETSTFYNFWEYPSTDPEFYQFSGGASSIVRKSSTELIAGATNIYEIPKGKLKAGDIVLIGNPYMSALDFNEFQAANSELIGGSGYSIYTTNTNYSDATYVAVPFNGASTPKIAPMQSFLVTLKSVPSEDNLTFNFVAEDMAKTSTDAKLYTSAIPNNRLTITVSNKVGKVKSYIIKREEAGDDFDSYDMPKVIDAPVETAMPEIYSLTKNDNEESKAVAINSIKSNNILIPLGFVTTTSGSTKIRLEGMNTYNAKISFIDLLSETPEIDITGMTYFDYPFEFSAELKDNGEAKTIEDRFMLRITEDVNDINNTNICHIAAYVNSNNLIVSSIGCTINSIEVYDIQGRIISRIDSVDSYYYRAENTLNMNGVYIVRVSTEHGVKEIKIIR